MNEIDTTGWLCPQHPFGHTWEHGTACRSCGAQRTPDEAVHSLLFDARGMTDDRANALLAGVRANALDGAVAIAEELAASLERHYPGGEAHQGARAVARELAEHADTLARARELSERAETRGEAGAPRS
ncbi:hypothetical protein ACTWJ8_39820 (plasmid) [Streptomyces sp. SDT5-1]|uniref:hypothetical protein n=1 Tax=Streptomyces sp. SDT5-1 TaxID=3406418 RepID=UPI003FD48087